MPSLVIDGLHKVQVEAIIGLEKSFNTGRPRALIQMATDAGKIFKAITSIYRLIKHAGANRILFLVDTNLDGKQIIGSTVEIAEVKGAIQVYEMVAAFDPVSEQDFLKAHAVLMGDVLQQAGNYRSGEVGVMGRREIVHMAPPAKRVPHLMGDLFSWLGNTGLHALVASSIFHYELEFIHPFEDGNGRMGRLWQTVILT